ncbi:MAG: hypothetical protein WC718_04250 [Phycisphaerales bacterium]|jgi:hypothetical protein
MTDELVIRRADNGWIVMRYVDGTVSTTVQTDADGALWDVIEALDMPTDRTNEQTGGRETLVCYYKPEGE